MLPILLRTALSGTVVSVASSIVLAIGAKNEGKDPIQPTNATGHWFLGDQAAKARTVDARHTLLGFSTHQAASVLWATVFQAVRSFWPGRRASVDAIGVSALAAFVDYVVVPKRLTPGWEKVVSPQSIAVAYGAMALALWVSSSPWRGR